MKKSDTTQNHEHTASFMLAEYELLKEFRGSMLSQMESRTNFLFTSVSAIATVLAIISQITGFNQSFLIIASILTFLLFLLGVITFLRLVEGHVSFTLYTRGINRIRRYFVDADSRIRNYVLLPITDNTPKFGVLGFSSAKISKVGNVGMAIFINTIIFGSFLALFTSMLLSTLAISHIFFIVLASVLVWFFQFRFYSSRTKRAEENNLSKFPTEDGG